MLIGNQQDWIDFGNRNKQFTACLGSLQDLIQLTFTRTLADVDFLDKVVFFLGNEAAEEFGEVLVLAANGYGMGAMKIVRGMFERIVTLSHLLRNPEDVDLWADFGDVSDHKLALATTEALGKSTVPPELSRQLERAYLVAKEKYQVPACKCGETRINHTWTRLDVVSMAKKDEFLRGLVIEGYYEPMSHTHTTRRSMLHRITQAEDGGLLINVGSLPDEADRAMCTAHKLLLHAIELNHEHFEMDNLQLRNQCWADCATAWHRLPKVSSTGD